MKSRQAAEHHRGSNGFQRVVYLASRRVVYWSSCLNNSPIIILNDYCYCDTSREVAGLDGAKTHVNLNDSWFVFSLDRLPSMEIFIDLSGRITRGSRG